MTEAELIQAAFWDCAVCLDCDEVFSPPTTECPACGNNAVYSAEFLLKVAAWLNSD